MFDLLYWSTWIGCFGLWIILSRQTKPTQPKGTQPVTATYKNYWADKLTQTNPSMEVRELAKQMRQAQPKTCGNCGGEAYLRIFPGKDKTQSYQCPECGSMYMGVGGVEWTKGTPKTQPTQPAKTQPTQPAKTEPIKEPEVKPKTQPKKPAQPKAPTIDPAIDLELRNNATIGKTWLTQLPNSNPHRERLGELLLAYTEEAKAYLTHPTEAQLVNARMAFETVRKLYKVAIQYKKPAQSEPAKAQPTQPKQETPKTEPKPAAPAKTEPKVKAVTLADCPF